MSNKLKPWQQLLAVICILAIYWLFNSVPFIARQAPPIGWKSCSPGSTQSPYCNFSLVYTLKGHPTAEAIALSSDSKILVSGGRDKAIKVWDLQTGELKKTLQSDSGVINSLAIAPDGKTVVSGSGDRVVRIWDLTSDRRPQMLKGHSGSVTRVRISADSKTIISVDRGRSSEVKVWDLATGEEKAALSYSHFDDISPDGKTVLLTLPSSQLVAWDVATNQQRVLQKSFNPASFARFGLDGETVVSVRRGGRRSGYLQVSDLKTGTVKARKRFFRKIFRIYNIVLTHHLIIGNTQKGLAVWNLETAELEATLNVDKMNGDRPSALAVSPDGKLLVGIAENPDNGTREIKVLRRPQTLKSTRDSSRRNS